MKRLTHKTLHKYRRSLEEIIQTIKCFMFFILIINFVKCFKLPCSLSTAAAAIAVMQQI